MYMTQEITTQDLELIKRNLDTGKALLGKAEGRLEYLNQQKETITTQIQNLGVEPENLDKEIQSLNEEISNVFTKAHSLIPYDLINK